jgi:ribosomal protein L11 methyltransferase
MWYEIKIKTTSEAVEAVNVILYEYDVSGIVIEDPNDPIYQEGYEGDWDYIADEAFKLEYDGALIKGYVEFEVHEVENKVAEIHQRIIDLTTFGLDPGISELSYTEVHEEDWVDEWKKYYKPFEIAENLVICPVWEDFTPQPHQRVIYLDPGKAFGTGTHETTSLCAQKLLAYSGHSKSLYDVGCGSGILAIIAAAHGFERVVGVDIDEKAIEASEENAALNGLETKISFLKGNLIDLLEEPADMIVANIIADVIILLASDIHRLMHQETIFVASGILVEKRALVEKALLENGFDVLEVEEKGEWCVIVSKRHTL